jgi:hypothetical protein
MSNHEEVFSKLLLDCENNKNLNKELKERLMEKLK